MKRLFLRPGKHVKLSDQAFEQAQQRVRQAQELSGITPAAMAKLAAYDGQDTIGLNPVAAKANKTGPKRVTMRLFKSRMAKAATRSIQVAGNHGGCSATDGD